MEKLYERIHEKIKFIAYAVFILGAAGAIIYACILYGDYEPETATCLLVLGPLAAYIGSLLIYAFGRIIEHLADIDQSLKFLTGKTDDSTLSIDADSEKAPNENNLSKEDITDAVTEETDTKAE